jgi:tripartite-type tricarboxylate transporter receptor subunit TctC
VETKSGGNGAICAQAVINARPDGLTTQMTFSGFHVMTPHLAKLPYEPLKDLQPVANVMSAPQVLVVRANLPFKTIAELVAYAKANPGKLNYSSAGNGSVQHIAAELFKTLTGAFITHIPYRGTGPMVQDLLASQVDLTLTTAPPLVGHITAGRLRPLLVTSNARLAALPNVPTAAEAGIKDFEVSSWFGLHTHAQAPKAMVERVAAEVQKIVQQPDIVKRFADQGGQITFMNPTDFGRYQTVEYERWGKVIKSRGIKAE